MVAEEPSSPTWKFTQCVNLFSKPETQRRFAASHVNKPYVIPSLKTLFHSNDPTFYMKYG